jgi:TRAP-type mannitol/chloroaromatic compound transport system permease large subunit
MLLIVAPLYIPIVASLGYDLVWYGVLYVITCEMAYLTPPFGYTLFIMRGIVPKEITMGDIYRSVIPFVAIQGGCLALVFAFPQIALWLPNLIMGR